ncbi:hypothetical protein GCM10017690_33560 [Microbacterium terregens]
MARGPLADVPEAIVDPRDIAEVAVRAPHRGRAPGPGVRLTGPQALTAREQLAVSGRCWAVTCASRRLPLSVQREMMLRHFSEETVNG